MLGWDKKLETCHCFQIQPLRTCTEVTPRSQRWIFKPWPGGLHNISIIQQIAQRYSPNVVGGDLQRVKSAICSSTEQAHTLEQHRFLWRRDLLVWPWSQHPSRCLPHQLRTLNIHSSRAEKLYTSSFCPVQPKLNTYLRQLEQSHKEQLILSSGTLIRNAPFFLLLFFFPPGRHTPAFLRFLAEADLSIAKFSRLSRAEQPPRGSTAWQSLKGKTTAVLQAAKSRQHWIFLPELRSRSRWGAAQPEPWQPSTLPLSACKDEVAPWWSSRGLFHPFHFTPGCSGSRSIVWG